MKRLLLMFILLFMMFTIGCINVIQEGKEVLENIEPIADAGEDVRVTAEYGTGEQEVILNGSKSIDEDGKIKQYVWIENGKIIAMDQVAVISFEEGSHIVKLEVLDDNGGMDKDTLTILVEPNEEFEE